MKYDYNTHLNQIFKFSNSNDFYMKAMRKSYDYSNKQNVHPNIQLPTTQDHSKDSNKLYPKVSSFKISTDAEVSWKKKIIGISDRQKALNNRLMRMLASNSSPKKIDILMTEAASHSHCSQKQLENTLRRYLYEHSNTSKGFADATIINQIIEQLQKTTQQIVGSVLPVDNSSNPQDILTCILQALKQFQTSKIALTDKFKEESECVENAT